MSPCAQVAHAANATRRALKNTASFQSPLPLLPSSNSPAARRTNSKFTANMANVQVQQQPLSQPHQHHHKYHHQRQNLSTTIHNAPPSMTVPTAPTTMSALQAPLPRHNPHYSTLRRPIPNSYWATPYLLACEYPWAPSTPRPKLDALLAAGVRTFIDLTESGELIGYSQLLPLRAHSCGLPLSESNTIQYFRFPIPDRSLPSSPQFLARILSVIAQCEAQKRVAAVHCRGGIGRTGTVVGCWLVQSGRCRDGEEALDVIAKHWATVEKHTRFPCSPETGAQAEFVRTFERLPTVDSLISAATTTTDPNATLTLTATMTETTNANSIRTKFSTKTDSVSEYAASVASDPTAEQEKIENA